MKGISMTALGITLVLVGILLVVAEAHVPGGVLGVAGGIALVVGGVVIVTALGGGAVLAIPIAVGVAAAGGAWLALVTGKALDTRRIRTRSGAEGLCGKLGVVRSWGGPSGQVFVDGALWRARRGAHDGDNDGRALSAGDEVVVERVRGLTLCVRRAEDWEVLE
jgi:membrane-bound ClpP family serine protease